MTIVQYQVYRRVKLSIYLHKNGIRKERFRGKQHPAPHSSVLGDSKRTNEFVLTVPFVAMKMFVIVYVRTYFY